MERNREWHQRMYVDRARADPHGPGGATPSVRRTKFEDEASTRIRNPPLSGGGIAMGIKTEYSWGEGWRTNNSPWDTAKRGAEDNPAERPAASRARTTETSSTQLSGGGIGMRSAPNAHQWSDYNAGGAIMPHARVNAACAPNTASPEVKQETGGPGAISGGGSVQPSAAQSATAAAPVAPMPPATVTPPPPPPASSAPAPAPAPVQAPELWAEITPAQAQHSQPAVGQAPQHPPPVPMYVASREGLRGHLRRRLARFYAAGHGSGNIGRTYLTPIVGPNGGPCAIGKQRRRFVHHYHNLREGGVNTLLFVPHSYEDPNLREYQPIHDALEELTKRYGRDQAYAELEGAMRRIAQWIADQGGARMDELEDLEGWEELVQGGT